MKDRPDDIQNLSHRLQRALSAKKEWTQLMQKREKLEQMIASSLEGGVEESNRSLLLELKKKSSPSMLFSTS